MKCFLLFIFAITISSSTIQSQDDSYAYQCQDPPLYSRGSDIYPKTPSFGMQLAQVLLGSTFNKEGMEKKSLQDTFEELAEWLIDFKVNTDNQFELEFIDGVETIVFTPHNIKNDHVLIYVHGGGFSSPIILFQWDMIVDVAKMAGSKVYIPLYTLSGEAQYPTQLNEIEAVYNHALSEHPNNGVVLIGDSAGGNLVLALTSKLINDKSTIPLRLIALSPWLDLELDNPDIVDYQEKDVLLNAGSLYNRSVEYVGEGNEALFDGALVSPLFADLTNFPPILFFIGTNEIFYPDAILFKEKAENAGMELDFIEVNGGFHVFPTGPKFLMPESVKSRRQMSSYINCAGNSERSTGLSENKERNVLDESLSFNVYPNPIARTSNVHLNENAKVFSNELILKITNALGQQLYSERVIPSDHKFNIGRVINEPGVYFIRLESPSQNFSITKRIIKH